MEDEQYEHIPWSQLLDERGGRWKRIVYVAAGIVAAVAVGIVVARWLAAPGHGETSVSSPVTATTVEVAAGEPVPMDPEDSNPPASNPVSSVSPTTAAPPVSEADLMATVPWPEAPTAARVRAEWFVTDYFTVDGDPEAAADIRRAFVEDAVLPELPHDVAADGAVSYVEWARAFSSEAIDVDRYAVDVAFRTVHLDADDEYVRGPVHAVRVLIVARDGGVGVADLPIPIVPPQAIGLSGWSVPEASAGDDVMAAAADYGFLFDAEPEIVEASGTAADWRAVVTIGDGSGIRWPLAIRSDATDASE
jgi:hypothetical protein